MDNKKSVTKFKEYEIVVRSITTNQKLFIKVLSAPTLCSSIKGQNIRLALQQTEFVKGLQLADSGQYGK